MGVPTGPANTDTKVLRLMNTGDLSGGPQTINTTFTKDGIRQEEWIFEDWESSAIVRHRYLYFEEGILMGGWYEGSRERRSRDFPAEKPHPKLQP